MASIALSMITKNEEVNLPIILALFGPYIDECVIVDSFSTDRTKFIAEQFGAKVIDRVWTNQYDVQKNVGVDAVTADWIISIDGDEFPSAYLCTNLKDLISRADRDGNDVIAISRQNYTSGVLHNVIPGEDLYDMHVRIFKKHLRWDGWHSEGIRGYQRRLDCPEFKIYHLKSLERGVRVHEFYRSIGMPVFPFPEWFKNLFGEAG